MATTTHWLPNLSAASRISSGRSMAAEFTEILSAPSRSSFPEIIYSTVPAPPNCKWNESTLAATFRHHIYYCVTLFTGGCNVKKYHFICSCCVVCFRNFPQDLLHPQVYEINTFHYSSYIYIQTGNNSLCKHNYASFPSFAKFSSIFRPYCCSSPVELAGKYVVLFTEA